MGLETSPRKKANQLFQLLTTPVSRRAANWFWIALIISFILGFLAINAFAQTPEQLPITLTWDANTESDLAGYKAYWCNLPATAETCSKPADASGSEDIGNAVQKKLSQTFVEGTVFAVTAYDSSGNESGFSNRAVAKDKIPPKNPTGMTIIVNIPGAEIKIKTLP